MKQIPLIVAIISTLAMVASCATTKDSALREQEKREQQIRDSIEYEVAKICVDKMDFTFAATSASTKRFTVSTLNPTTNFIIVHDGQATIQTANDRIFGLNGVGGITVSGIVSGVNKKIDKKGTTSLEFNIQGRGVNARVFITLPRGSNNATASVYPNFNSMTLTMYGKIKPYESTYIFKGKDF